MFTQDQVFHTGLQIPALEFYYISPYFKIKTSVPQWKIYEILMQKKFGADGFFLLDLRRKYDRYLLTEYIQKNSSEY